MKNNTGSNIAGIILGVIIMGIIVIPLMVYSIWAYAFVGAQLWEWFVVSTFGLDPISTAQAWGVSLLLSLWTCSHYTCKSKDEREHSEKIAELVGLLTKPWFYFLLGWICYHYFLAK